MSASTSYPVSPSGSTSPSSSSSTSSEEDDRREHRRRARLATNETLRYMINYMANNVIPRMIQPKPRSQNRRRRRYIERNREEGHTLLFNDYFSENPVYTPQMFRRRFRMRRALFLRIVNGVGAYDDYFQSNPNATGRGGHTPLQKCTAAIRLLAYGEAADRVDEYLRMGVSTVRVALEKFTTAVINVFGSEYLRSPNVNDLQRILHVGTYRGFPGMLGSIDCMHWIWKNCPTAWRGQYQGRSGDASVILEAVATQDLWIWHSFFGVPGSCNDINVLHRSPVFDDVLNGRAPRVHYVINDQHFDTGYYLTDGIYPQWSTFIQSISLPQTPKDRLFAQRQEAARKDVERAFGVLQARFHCIRRPALTWSESLLSKIMTTCIILHNMIVEDERDTYANYDDYSEYDDVDSQTTVEDAEYEAGYRIGIDRYIENRDNMHSRNTHLSLKANLVEHIWHRFGNH